MTTISASVDGLTADFDTETLALLEAAEVPLPEFGDVDLDVVFGTPLDLCEDGLLPHERWEHLEASDAVEALRALYDRKLAAVDILADDPNIAVRVRHRLVDVLLPYAAQLRNAPEAGAVVLSAAA